MPIAIEVLYGEDLKALAHSRWSRGCETTHTYMFIRGSQPNISRLVRLQLRTKEKEILLFIMLHGHRHAAAGESQTASLPARATIDWAACLGAHLSTAHGKTV